MKGGELKRFREEQGWTQDDLAKMLKATVGKGSSTTVGKWEAGTRPVPDDVARVVAQLQLDAAMPGEQPLDEAAFGLPGEDAPPPLGFASPPVEGSEGSSDTPPPEPVDPSQGAAPAGQLPLGARGSYATVCTELWELIATGVGMVGAVTGSQGLQRDGEILHADREALGRAWGKLAETNDTFRRMLLASTTSGAWLEVAMVSGITFGKCYRSHQEINQAKAAEQARMEAEWAAEHPEEVGDYGYPEPAAA